MNIKAKLLFFAVSYVLLFAACGQKGDLYLPETQSAKKEAVTIEPKNSAESEIKKKLN